MSFSGMIIFTGKFRAFDFASMKTIFETFEMLNYPAYSKTQCLRPDPDMGVRLKYLNQPYII